MRITVFKLVVVALLAGLACSQTHADDWTGPDKTKHFAVSAVIGAAAYAITEDRSQAFMLALAPGLAKEIYDSTQSDNHFSSKDMLWNALGAAVGVQVGFVVFKPNEVSVSWKF